MKISLVEKNAVKEVFEIQGATPAYVNSLRRVFTTNVPTMAISKVEFKKNSSALYDEIIAHRLGLTVLKTDLSSYNIPKKGDPVGPATHCTFTLKVVGPNTVYASDLKSSDPAIKPVHPQTIIAKLLEGQELEFVATAHLGFGLEHSKWVPGLMTYYYTPVIKVNNKAPSFKDAKVKFPSVIFNAKGEIDASKINHPQLIDACRDIDDAVFSITYKNPNDEFVFTIEPWGQLTPSEIVEAGIKQFNLELDELKKLISGA